MGSATDLLSYFVMGTDGHEAVRRRTAPSTPTTISTSSSRRRSPSRTRRSWRSTSKPSRPIARTSCPTWKQRSTRRLATNSAHGATFSCQRAGWPTRRLALLLARSPADPEFTMALRRLTLEYPTYAPGRALWAEYERAPALEPRLLETAVFMFLNEDGWAMEVEISAVLVPVSITRASIMFVDNRARTVYGQVYVDDYEREASRCPTGSRRDDGHSGHVRERAGGCACDAESAPLATDMLRSIAATIKAQVWSEQRTLAAVSSRGCGPGRPTASSRRPWRCCSCRDAASQRPQWPPPAGRSRP